MPFKGNEFNKRLSNNFYSRRLWWDLSLWSFQQLKVSKVSFYLIQFSRHWLKTIKKKQKKTLFFPFQGQELLQGIIWQLLFLKTFVVLIIRIISAIERIWLNLTFLESNQGNQGYSDNQKNVIRGQRPDMVNRYTQQRT